MVGGNYKTNSDDPYPLNLEYFVTITTDITLNNEVLNDTNDTNNVNIENIIENLDNIQIEITEEV